MRTIYKYPLEITDYQPVLMPVSATILSVQVQRGVPCLWAMVDSDSNEPELRQIFIHGTGHRINQNAAKHIGTFQLHEGALVFHVFEGARQ